MAAGKLRRPKMSNGLQSNVVAPRNAKLAREAEEPVTVSTCCGQVGAVVRLETAPVSLLCPSLRLSSSMVKLGTTSPSLQCHAAVGGGHHAAVGD